MKQEKKTVRNILCITLMTLSLAGCHSLPSADVPVSMRPSTGSDVSYLVGVVGIWPDAVYTAQEQKLLIRQRGGNDVVSPRLLNTFYARTPRDVREHWHGIGTLFVLPLKAGRYEIFNVLFERGSVRTWKREDFSIPLELEAGKAYYVGDFRAGCIDSQGSCAFFHSNHLQRDAALVRAQHPEVPELQQVELKGLEGAYPSVMEEDGPKASVFKSMISGRMK